MIMSQILKPVDFTKTQISRYLENATSFFLQIKKFINYTSRTTLLQKNSFVAEVTFKVRFFLSFIYLKKTLTMTITAVLLLLE